MNQQPMGHFSSVPERAESRITLPSGRKITVLEMTGKEETMLSSGFSKKNKHHEVINKFLQSLVKDLDEEQGTPSMQEIENLLTGDRSALFLHIRDLTHGNIVELELECKSCTAKTTHEIDIAPILEGIKPYPNGDERDFSVEIGGHKLFFSLPDGKVEKKVSDRAKREIDVNIKLHCMRFWEETPNGRLPVDVSNLRSKDLGIVRKQLKELECDIDSIAHITCPECGDASTASLVENPRFLFPSLT